ncbi:MAG: hydrogenase maturation nickel metallochaperone HypA [Methylotetracoccus sp.]
MHELSLCMDVIEQLTALAAEHRARAVSSVTVRIGPLSGVEPGLLESAFVIARDGTVADGANFIVEAAPVRVRCNRCERESEAQPTDLRCPSCGNEDTHLVTGNELTLASVELAVPDDRQPASRDAAVH